jgi:hypothetical protein
VQFVTVAPDVELEVLDWGGSGRVMVLLTGLGDNEAIFFRRFVQTLDDRDAGVGQMKQPIHEIGNRVFLDAGDIDDEVGDGGGLNNGG